VTYRTNRACSDPYKRGCELPAVMLTIAWRVNEAALPIISVDDSTLTYVIERVTIFLCNRCAGWECDHDWTKEPDGPLLPTHVTRFERVS